MAPKYRDGPRDSRRGCRRPQGHVGHPFVGPAGKLLDRGLADAGLDRDEVYVTNAVKHFRWESRGKRRIHRKPSMAHISAYRPWLDAELAVVKPEVLVCLGATAAQAILGRTFKVTQHRGEIFDAEGIPPHPSLPRSIVPRFSERPTTRLGITRWRGSCAISPAWLACSQRELDGKRSETQAISKPNESTCVS